MRRALKKPFSLSSGDRVVCKTSNFRTRPSFIYPLLVRAKLTRQRRTCRSVGVSPSLAINLNNKRPLRSLRLGDDGCDEFTATRARGKKESGAFSSRFRGYCARVTRIYAWNVRSRWTDVFLGDVGGGFMVKSCSWQWGTMMRAEKMEAEGGWRDNANFELRRVDDRK